MKRFLLIALAVVVIGGGIIAYFGLSTMRKVAVPRNLESPLYAYIPSGSSFEAVLDTLNSLGTVPDEQLFRLLAEQLSYIQEPMRAGRYELQPGWTYYELIDHLRAGERAPVRLVLATEREPADVAAKAARYLATDSAALVTLFQDSSFLDSIGYRSETLQSLFIPNTYEVYWNSSPREFVARMRREHTAFWDREERREKAAALGMTPEEVYTLASIVEKETLVNKERQRMAGVYLNRLRKGMLLQSDPTAVFARRDFSTGQVWDYHTKFDSPYNTYMYKGLPPGPIAMASIGSIDAVLSAEQHDYLYFCAVGDGSGLHNFAETHDGHLRNKRLYKANLRKRGLL